VKEPEGAGGSSRRSGIGSARPAKVGLGIAVDFVPESDPAYPIIAAILRVVPASRWAFARLQARGELGRLLGSGGNGADRSRLESEFASQRAKSKTGSRIAATLGPLGEFESGVTLLFADARANFGILTLMRTGDLGPFTSSEISVLTLALDAVSEHLSALQLNVTDTDVDPISWTLPALRRKSPPWQSTRGRTLPSFGARSSSWSEPAEA